MKKISIILMIALFTSSLYSEDPVGKASLQGVQASESSSFQNWAFLGTSLALIAIGIFAVSLDQGSPFHGGKKD